VHEKLIDGEERDEKRGKREKSIEVDEREVNRGDEREVNRDTGVR
jgi:hypothetical protein